MKLNRNLILALAVPMAAPAGEEEEMSHALTNPVAVVEVDDDVELLAGDTDKLYIVSGSSGLVTFTLPAAAEGLRFRFFNGENQDMKVRSGAADMFGGAEAFGEYDELIYQTVAEKAGAHLYLEAMQIGETWKWVGWNLSDCTLSGSVDMGM